MHRQGGHHPEGEGLLQSPSSVLTAKTLKTLDNEGFQARRCQAYV